jgi:hypothetical protein
MAAGEHHPQLIVAQLVLVEERGNRRYERPLGFEQEPDVRREGARALLAAQHVDRAVLGGRHEPRCRVFG